MTKHEAALLLERMVDEGKDLTPEAVEALYTAINVLRDNQWISCEKQMPEETDSIFAKLYGTDRWRPGMMRKRSGDVIVTYEYDDGERQTGSCRTNDGEWSVNKVIHQKVLAWMPFPDPYQPEPEEHTGCTEDACPI